MVLALADKWIWDFWLAEDGGDWHAYFLQADNTLANPDMRHWHVSHGHAVSRNLKDWTYRGTCFGPAREPAWDDCTTWTGSVLRDDSGVWHLFYTGTTHETKGVHQRIGHATSTDMHSWARVGNGLALDLTGPNASAYEEYTPHLWHERAMRDPWVIRDPDGSGWLMYFTARVPGRGEANDGGAIGLATSQDLINWTLQEPVYDGGMFGQLEVPQVMRHGDKWYCLFCTSEKDWSEAYRRQNPQSPVTGTHYLVADHHLGPWKVASGSFLYGHSPARTYAGKIVNMNGDLLFLGFSFYGADGRFVGQIGDPLPVSVDDSGRLHVQED